MMTISASHSMKAPIEGQDYSSQSYHVGLEVEVADTLDGNGIIARTHELFDLARLAVTQQLMNGTGKANGNGRVNVNGGGNGSRVVVVEEKKPEEWIPKQDPNNPIITPKQRQFLVALVQKRFKGGIKAFEAHLREEGITSVSMLTRRQASQIIDDLAGKNGNGNGNGRGGGR